MLIALGAVKKGLLTQEDVQAAMDECKRLEARGEVIRIEDWLIGQGKLTPSAVVELRGQMESLLPSGPRGVPVELARRIPIYEIHEKIGEGGMATVFSAWHRETRQPRAVKILFKEHLTNKAFVERFVREGRLLKEFDCPSIAKGYEFGRAGKELYFMGMELIDGESLQDMLERDGPFSEQKAVFAITEAAKALAYMQSQGIVHRDIKPDNIMWTRDGTVKLVDLGFAKSITGASGDGSEFESETCGTVQYISPEQARGKADIDIRADIYSLGATLYHLVMGELPFKGKDTMDIMSKQVMASLDAARLKGGKISMHMHYFIEKMMAKEREVRYQSAQEVVDDISEVLKGASDLQYDPDNDQTVVDPFAALSQRAGAISGRLTPATHRSGRLPSTQTSVRLPVAGGASTRRPPVPAGNGSPNNGNGHGTAHGNITAHGLPVRLPQPRPSVRTKVPGADTTQIRRKLP
jgi:serine/threonine-protein kinase